MSLQLDKRHLTGATHPANSTNHLADIDKMPLLTKLDVTRIKNDT